MAAEGIKFHSSPSPGPMDDAVKGALEEVASGNLMPGFASP
jgi:hypothetical protein